MRCYTRGIGAGRWVWGNFLARAYDSADVVSYVQCLLDTDQSICVHVPGIGNERFLCAKVSDGNRKYSVRLSENALRRLSWRYMNAMNIEAVTSRHDHEEIVTSMRRAILQVMIDNSELCRSTGAANSWTVTPSFYEMASILVHASCELFSDAVNESGVLQTFCSISDKDADFGSRGSWQSADGYISGGAGNPPFEKGFVSHLIHTCDVQVSESRPYCRLLLLPAAPKYRVADLCENGQGFIILYIPPNNIGFKKQSSFLENNQNTAFPHPLREQSIYLCIWANDAYFRTHAPPRDVENILRAWVMFSCRAPESVVFNFESISIAFPAKFRSSQELADNFVKDL